MLFLHPLCGKYLTVGLFRSIKGLFKYAFNQPPLISVRLKLLNFLFIWQGIIYLANIFNLDAK